MTALADWTNFFVAEVGATAALTGLVPGVALSLLGGIVNTWVLLVEILR